LEGIFESIITKNMALLATAAVSLMLIVGKITLKNNKAVNQTKFWGDWGTFILAALCVAGAFLPGVSDIPAENWGANLVFGLVSTIVAHLGRSILKPLIVRKLEGKHSVRKE
jgi:hypothetical protein